MKTTVNTCLTFALVSKSNVNNKKGTLHLKFYEKFHIAFEMIDEKIIHYISLMSS